MRESTWHRVGQKNDRFLLTRHDLPNGVSITGGEHSGSPNGLSPSGISGSVSGTRSGHDDSNTVCNPVHHRSVDEGVYDSCTTPTREDDEESFSQTTAAAAAKGAVGGAGAFITPEARPSSEIRGHAGVAAPRRTRGTELGSAKGGGSGGGSGGGGGGSGFGSCGEKLTIEESARHRGERKETAAAEGSVLREPYRIKLALSSQQRDDVEAAAASTVATATTAAAVSAGETSDAVAVAAARRGDVVHIACAADRDRDMYQLGRMHSAENDFAVRGPLHQSMPSGKVCGPVSRYAMRLLVDRDPPNRCRIFTGGFNERWEGR